MNHGVDESAMPGECPLCLAAVPVPAEPRSVGDVLAVLAQHFEKACAAIVFPSPHAAWARPDASAQRDKAMPAARMGRQWHRDT